MNKIILKLIDEISSKKINKEEFIEKFYSLTKLSLDEEFCLKQIEAALISKDSDTIDIFISVGFIIGFTQKALPILCKLIVSPYNYNHEDIARLFQEIKDSSTVDCLYQATEMQFSYLDYDETFQFARKCIKALSAIGNNNAIDKLKLLSNSKTPQISEYAKKELHYKGL